MLQHYCKHQLHHRLSVVYNHDHPYLHQLFENQNIKVKTVFTQIEQID